MSNIGEKDLMDQVWDDDHRVAFARRLRAARETLRELYTYAKANQMPVLSRGAWDAGWIVKDAIHHMEKP